jgi:sec-independent protein translocase protein TatA
MGELLIVLFVILLVFGANKIPQLGDGLGRAIRNFKKGLADPPAAPPPAAGPPASPDAPREPPKLP